MKRSIRFGMLGCAHYHAQAWCEAVSSCPHAQLVGIWDDLPSRGIEAGRRHQTRYYPDLDALLRECDAVGITSETVKHAQLVEVAAGHGVHVLCEKPLAVTHEDCLRIRRAVEKSRIVFMQNFPKRFDVVNHELVRMVKSGSLGEIALVNVRHGNCHGFEPDFTGQWYANPALSGGGALLDEGVHAADFLLWLIGAPLQVSAHVSHRALGLAVEDTAHVSLIFPSGTLAGISTSWAYLAAESSVEIYGTQGVALLSGVDLASQAFSAPPYLRVFHHGGKPGEWEGSSLVPLFGQSTFHHQGPLRFIDCLLYNQPPPTGLDEGEEALRVILAAYQAARGGGMAREQGHG